MRGIVEKYELRKAKNKNTGKEFSFMDITVKIENDNREVRRYRASMSETFARKYFQAYGKKTSETIGAPCEVMLTRIAYTDSDGQTREVNRVKFFNLLDENGNIFKIKSDGKPVNTPDF